MKKYLLVLLMASLYSVAETPCCAQEATSKNDSITNAVKLKSLQIKRESLLQKIKVEDEKRNVQINGITPERQEELNNCQDSICLSLRSQLVDVVLEIKEIAPSVTSPQLMQQYNNLLNSQKEKQTAGNTNGSAKSKDE